MKLGWIKLSAALAAFILAMMPASASATVEKYGVFGWSSNTMHGCGKGFANIVTAQPVKIISRFAYWDRSDHGTAQMRILSYWYDNHKEKLDRVAKTTNLHWGVVVWGDTPEEAMKKAEQYSMFNTSQFGCDGPLYRIDMSGFDKLQATTGAWGDVGEERSKMLRTYFDKDQ